MKFQKGNQAGRKPHPKSKTIPIRALPSEVDLIDAAAQKCRLTRSEFMLRAAKYLAHGVVQDGHIPGWMDVVLVAPKRGGLWSIFEEDLQAE